MSSYKISRALLKSRLSKIKFSDQEIQFITNAIFAYLSKIAATAIATPFSIQSLVLNRLDFKFLYVFYTDDQFCNDFALVFRDMRNSVIEFSDQANNADHAIREVLGLGSSNNGLYTYILNFDKVALSDRQSIAEEFLIEDNLFEDSSKFQKPMPAGSFKDALPVKEVYEKRSYIDSVMSVLPNNTAIIDADSNKIESEEIPFFNGTPQGNALQNNRSAAPVILRSETKKSPLRSENVIIPVKNDSLVRYPVLNFLLSRSRN